MNAQTKIEADPRAKLEAALAEALPKLEGAKKNSTNPHFKSKYPDLGAVKDAIRPVAEHGIWYRQVTHEGSGGVSVETLYIGFGTSISAGTLFMPANKNDAQGYGSALTYARRYSLQTAFGLEAEDDDGNAAARGQTRETQTPPSQPADMPDAEWAKLVQLIEATKSDTTAMCKHYGVKNLRQLNQDQYGNALTALKSKLAKMAKAETNAKAGEEAPPPAGEFDDLAEDSIPY